jgi:hypothetical protein
MKSSILDNPRRVAGACLLVLAGAGLSACGGGGGDGSSATPPPGSEAPPRSTIDAFFQYVEARVDAMLDSDEPIDIEAVTATTQDTTEPEPLK